MSKVCHHALITLAVLLVQACVLGDQPTTDSPYDTAYFSLSTSAQVADGTTPIVALVHGNPGSTLTLRIANALFVTGDDGELQNEKTIQLITTGDDGEGLAEVQVVATRPGLATLSFKLAPLSASVELDFRPLRVWLGPPQAVSMEPGAIIHELCVYANTRHGTLQASSSSGAISPERIKLTAFSDSVCVDQDTPWTGAASISWSTTEDQSNVDLNFLGPQDQVLLHSLSEVHGQRFPGYRAILQGVEVTAQWARVQAQILYSASEELGESKAGSVLLHDLRSVPPGLRLVGSSSGTISAPQTDAEGEVTLFFEMPSGDLPVSVFATPEGGGTLFLGEVTPPRADH